jgi:catechol 2,3-dioxygenase-like lactoylglutathione lyase family enzyme
MTMPDTDQSEPSRSTQPSGPNQGSASEPMWISSVTIGVPDTHQAVRFYHRLLGWTVTADDPPREGEPPGAGWAQLRAPEGARGLITVNLEYESQYQRPVWPSRSGHQTATTHLDIPVEDLNAAVARALDAGATLADFQPQEDVRVMLDPAGHPFCLFR